MRLKPLLAFIRDHCDEPRPDPRTVQRWPGAKKLNGRWYVDMDEWTAHFIPRSEILALEKDPAVAAVLRAVS